MKLGNYDQKFSKFELSSGNSNTNKIYNSEIIFKPNSRFDRILINIPSYFSGQYSHYSQIKFLRENYGLRLFIENSFEDRVNFWNSTYNYEESKHFNLAFLSMRIPITNIYDQTFIKYLKNFILYKYYAISSDGQVKLYSYPFLENELIKFKDILDLGSLVQIPKSNIFIP